MWWCDKSIQGESDNYDGAANSDYYENAPAESEGDDDDDVREGGDPSYKHYDPATVEEGDDDDGGYDYAPAA
ncbi:hypothetical protein AgCh_006608 [Apium graveolens]